MSKIAIEGSLPNGNPFRRELDFPDDAKFRADLHRVVQATNGDWETMTPSQEMDWVLTLLRTYLKQIVVDHKRGERSEARQAEDAADVADTL